MFASISNFLFVFLISPLFKPQEPVRHSVPKESYSDEAGKSHSL